MTDYGHDLEFGVFLSPDAEHAARTLELAQLADVVGLDLVTVQDHPHLAQHLDTWTLLAVIAARTSVVRVAPNVANLPLRPPVVLARAVASLDILSDGRAELGLGAGAMWDGIVAAGGPRLTPGESVDALEEGIAIIRAVWGLAGNHTADVDGEHHHVKGLHAGPHPVHQPGIWLGAYKPRMLRLTGRLADGWLPSLGYVETDDLRAHNAVIDEAAEAAGRAPQAIRRMLNIFAGHAFLRGGPDVMAERLAGLVLDAGMSTFILGSDDADEIHRFAAEVAPAVRALVDAERSRGASSVEPTAPASVEASSVVARGERQRARVGSSLPQPTPDDGTRLSPSMPWDEAARPTHVGPDDASYPSHQRAIPQHLLDIHQHLRGELDQVRDIVDQVRRGAVGVGAARSVINTMTMRQNNWTLGAYCESYCRVVTGHHTLEDHSVFPHLLRREPDLGAVLGRLQEEHLVIHDVLEQVDHALVGLVGSQTHGAVAAEALDELQRALDLLTDTLLSHLAYEERELIPPLARHGFA